MIISTLFILILGVVLGILIEQARFCNLMQKFFEENEVTKENAHLWAGVFYLSDYLEKYYE